MCACVLQELQGRTIRFTAYEEEWHLEFVEPTSNERKKWGSRTLGGENSEAPESKGTGILPSHRATSKKQTCDSFPMVQDHRCTDSKAYRLQGILCQEPFLGYFKYLYLYFKVQPLTGTVESIEISCGTRVIHIMCFLPWKDPHVWFRKPHSYGSQLSH